MKAVVATKSVEEIEGKSQRLSQHKCQTCAAEFEVNAKVPSPFCVECGGPTDQIKGKSNEVRSAIASSEDSVAIQCSNDKCKTLNVIALEAAKEGGHMHCVCCGTHMSFAAPVEQTPAPIVDPAAPAVVADEEGEGEEEEENIPAPEENLEMVPEEVEGPVGEVDEVDESVDDAPAPTETPTCDCKEILVDLLQTLDEAALSASAMVHTGSAIYLKAGDIFVASLLRETAGQNAEIFEDDAFVDAINISISSKGLAQTIEDFGFKKMQARISIPTKVSQDVEAAVAARKAELEAAANEQNEAFKQCLALSAMGHATGFFSDVQNPLAAALIEDLRAFNVRGADKIVASTMFRTAKDYAASVIAKAVDLLGKDVGYRNDVAANLDKVNPSALLLQQATDDDTTDGNLEARLASTARPVTSRQENTASTATASNGKKPRSPQIAAVLQRRGGSLSVSPYKS